MDMILTGRAVDSKEALAIGLVNKLVSPDQLMAESLSVAELLCSFPQSCLRADRLSAVGTAAMPMREALAAEFERGHPIVAQEAVAGAGRFASGNGRHGDWVAKL